jgi:hypothetical protein
MTTATAAAMTAAATTTVSQRGTTPRESRQSSCQHHARRSFSQSTVHKSPILYRHKPMIPALATAEVVCLNTIRLQTIPAVPENERWRQHGIHAIDGKHNVCGN